MAWLSLVLYPVGRIVTYLSMGILKILGLKGRRYASAFLLVEKEWIQVVISCFFVCVCVSEPYVTEDELKLMLRGAELSGAIEEEEQVIS